MHALRSLALAFTVALALAAAGCSPPWQVLHAGPTAPLRQTNQFMAMPVEFRDVFVEQKPEAQYLAELDGEDRQAHAEYKQILTREFQLQFQLEASRRGVSIVPATVPPTSPFLIRLNVRKMNPGFYAVFAAPPTELEAVMLITDLNGTIFDEVIFPVSVPAGFNTRKTRFSAAAGVLARNVAEYMHERLGLP